MWSGEPPDFSMSKYLRVGRTDGPARPQQLEGLPAVILFAARTHATARRWVLQAGSPSRDAADDVRDRHAWSPSGLSRWTGAPGQLRSTWLGHSTGTWDRDTLVIDSIGFQDRGWLDFAGYPHSNRLHINRSGCGELISASLQIELTLDDPGAFRKPWTITKIASFAPDEEIQEIRFLQRKQQGRAPHRRQLAPRPQLFHRTLHKLLAASSCSRTSAMSMRGLPGNLSLRQ